MPLGLANPPGILTPGRGPNGPGPFDFRRPATPIPYGAAGYGPGFCARDQGWGYAGPAAGSLRLPTDWYIRVGGSNLNGGSSASLTAERSGTDGILTNLSKTFQSATAAFTFADVGKGICAGGFRYKIVAVVDATHCTLDRNMTSTVSGQAWAIGGAWADPRAAIGDVAVNSDTNGPVLSGDSVYIGAGVYRVQCSPGTNWQPAYNGVVSIIGDVTGQFTGDAGMVQQTMYLTNDKTLVSAGANWTLSTGGTSRARSNLAFWNLYFVGGTSSTIFSAGLPVAGWPVGSQNIFFTDCAFSPPPWSSDNVASITVAFGAAANWLFDRIQSYGGQTGGFSVTALTGSAGNDYPVYVGFQNSWLYTTQNGGAISFGNTGTLTFKGGGLMLRNMTSTGFGLLGVTALQLSTVIPSLVYNCLIVGLNSNGLNAGTLGQIIEDYNFILSATPRTNINAGPHSITGGTYAPLFHFGQERIWGALPRLFMEPMAGSPILGFGNDGGQTPYDLWNRPRPGGGVASPLPAVGALERGSTAVQAQSPVPPSGTNVWQFTGPGYQDFLLPVSAVANGFSISVQRDAAYSPGPGYTNPSVQMLPNATIGVAGQTVVDSGAAGGWNTLSLASFTPTGTGWVTIRIRSSDGTGGSVVSFAVAAPS